MKENSCKGLFGLIFGHKYVARYTTEDDTPKEVADELGKAVTNYVNRVTNGGIYLDSLHNSGLRIITHSFENLCSKKSTYVQDICSRCGKVIHD